MPRAFADLRVSTAGQTTENQPQELAAAGIGVEAVRIVAETISGSVAAMERPGSAHSVYRLEPGDRLVVKRMDRLGRNAMDVMATIEHLATLSIRVESLALGDADLTSPAGRMTTGLLDMGAQGRGRTRLISASASAQAYRSNLRMRGRVDRRTGLSNARRANPASASPGTARRLRPPKSEVP